VQLVPTDAPWAAGFTATSDSAGRFTIRDVPPGRYTFGFQHPRLDSLGFDAVSRPLALNGNGGLVTANLALPGAVVLHGGFCGVRRDTTGVVLGRVRDAGKDDVPTGLQVVVEWSELRISTAGAERTTAYAAGLVGRDGRYVVCGVPTDAPVALRAARLDSAATSVSGSIEVRLNATSPLLHRDLFVASAHDSGMTVSTTQRVPEAVPTPDSAAQRGRARLVGVIRNADGQPVPGARITVADARAMAISASDGSYRLASLPTGTRRVDVIMIGYAPLSTAADLRPNQTVTLNPILQRRTAMLDSVAVYAAATRDYSGFEARRKKGLGYFVTAAQARKSGARDVLQALVMAPGLRGGGISGRGGCRPVVYVDGLMFGGGLGGFGSPLDTAIPFSDVGGIEVYANSADAPAQFGSPGNQTGLSNSGGCSVVVVWSKGFVPDPGPAPTKR
jgi:hypothetical protein